MIDDQIKGYEELMNISVSPDVIDGSSRQVLLSSRSKVGDIPLNQQLKEIAKDIKDVAEKVDEIAERENRTEFDVITINGIVEVEGEGRFKEIVVERLGGEPVTELLQDIVR